MEDLVNKFSQPAPIKPKKTSNNRSRSRGRKDPLSVEVDKKLEKLIQEQKKKEKE
jgi:hypothetical protein